MDYITEFVDDNPHKPLPKQDFPDMIPQIIQILKNKKFVILYVLCGRLFIYYAVCLLFIYSHVGNIFIMKFY